MKSSTLNSNKSLHDKSFSTVNKTSMFRSIEKSPIRNIVIVIFVILAKISGISIGDGSL